MTLTKQNREFLKAAAAGSELPKYVWPKDGAPNCPPLPDPAAEHAAAVAAEIADIERQIAGGVAMYDNRDELREVLEVGAQYLNDITRLPAFARYAALCRFYQNQETNG